MKNKVADTAGEIEITSDSSYDCPRGLSHEFLGASLDEIIKIIIDRGWNFQLNSKGNSFTGHVWDFENNVESFSTLSNCPNNALQIAAINLELNLNGS